MDRYYHYWRFFCGHTFAEEDKLLFLDDGSFAIATSQGVVSLFSPLAEPVKHYENALILQNECICERYGENLIVHHGKKQYGIPCPSTMKIKQFANAVAFEENTEKRTELYFITPQKQNLRHLSFAGKSILNVSASGMIAFHAKLGEDDLLDEQQRPLQVQRFFRIDFLPHGSYIVHFSKENAGCSLYNAQHEEILHTSQEFGILPLGDKVVYDQSLIICPQTGRILEAYQKEQDICDTMHIYAHHITGGSRPYFWLGGKIMFIDKPVWGKALCYWHGGHFYLAPQTGNYTEDELRSHDASAAWQHYVTRILELMP